MIVYPFIHPSAMVGGIYNPDIQAAWEEADSRRIIELNRMATEVRSRRSARYGDGSDGRDIAAEVVMRLDSKGRLKR